jgi:hypothetical protein
MKRRCASVTSAEEVQARHRHIRGGLSRRSLAHVMRADLMYVNITYWMLYCNDATNVSLGRFQSQHQILNACFNRVNLSASKVPQSGPYNFWNVRGDAGIAFAPLDYTQLNEDHIQRILIPCSTVFNGLNEAVKFLTDAGHALVPGHINVIAAPLSGFLGEAALFDRVCVIDAETVGGELLNSPISTYNLGITAVHEVGHVLGLPHPFDQSCVQTFADVPTLRRPNYDFKLVQNTDGTWGGQNCNRFKDCKYYRDLETSYGAGPHSCFNCVNTGINCTQCDTDVFEQACNFMDYVDDGDMGMFSLLQCQAVREYLASAESMVTVVDGELGATVPSALDGVVPTDGGTGEKDGNASRTANSLLGMPVWAFGLAVAGGVVLLILAVYALVRLNR